MQARQFISKYNRTAAMDQQISPRQQSSYQTEYRGRIRLLESKTKASRRQKYRTITKSVFWVYRKNLKVTQRKEEKTRTKYNRDLCVEP
jgi:hypothetical protein